MDEKLLDNVLAHADSYASTRGGNWQKEEQNIAYALVHGIEADKLHNIQYSTCFGRLNSLNWESTSIGTVQAMLVQMQWRQADGGKKGFDKNFHLYYEWLFNWSPYRDAFITKNATDATKKGVVIVDADINGRIMVGGAICLRHPFETFSSCRAIRPLVGLWTKMVESGYNPNYAFIVAMGLTQTAEGWVSRGHSFGHASLRYGDVDYPQIHQNFVLDRKIHENTTYKSSRSYSMPSALFSTPLEKGMKKMDFTAWLKTEMNLAATSGLAKINPFSSSETKSASTDAVIKHFSQFQDEFTKAVA
jgi:hypothetical protein